MALQRYGAMAQRLEENWRTDRIRLRGDDDSVCVWCWTEDGDRRLGRITQRYRTVRIHYNTLQNGGLLSAGAKARHGRPSGHLQRFILSPSANESFPFVLLLGPFPWPSPFSTVETDYMIPFSRAGADALPFAAVLFRFPVSPPSSAAPSGPRYHGSASRPLLLPVHLPAAFALRH